MASTVGNRPAQYRARARQLREQAQTAGTEATRTTLLRDADMWDRMAEYEAKNPTHDFSTNTVDGGGASRHEPSAPSDD